MNYRDHRAKWNNCTACSLCERRRHVVLYRGDLPCDVLFIGEAPGTCIAGDTLIETAYRDVSKYPNGIPVKDLVGKSGFHVYSFGANPNELKLGKVNKVWMTGTRKVYKVSFFWWGAKPDGSGGRQKYFGSIRVTANHPFLLKSGEYRSILQGLAVGNRLQPFYRRGGRYSYVGVSSGSLKLESRILMEHRLGRELEEGEEVHHDDRNKFNNTDKNLILLDQREHARLHGVEDNAMFNPVHRETHRKVMDSSEYRTNMSNRMKGVLANPEVYAARLAQIQRDKHKIGASVKQKFASDPMYYYKYLKGRRWKNGKVFSEEEIETRFKNKFPEIEYPPQENHQITSIVLDGFEPVYDIEVEGYHNFAANGIFVHNSEDDLGQPFVGPAGQLLDLIIARALMDKHVEKGFTNLVACIPIGEDGKKAIEPPTDAIEACSTRLEEIMRLAGPRGLIGVGKLSKHALERHKGIPSILITHPAAILRAEKQNQGLMVQNCGVSISDFIEELNL